MLFGGLVLVIGSTTCYQWWDIPSTWVIVGAIVAFIGFVVFYKGIRVTLSNWYWWHFGGKGTIVGLVLLSLVLIVGYMVYEGSLNC